MPSGYTAKLAEGEQDLADFIKGCGRGMGFMIMERDSAWSDPLPEKWEISDFHDKKLAELQERKVFLNALSEETLKAACDDFYSKADQDRTEYIAKNKQQLRRYQQMLVEVKAWQPSHPVMRSTRAFAIEQLEKSIDFDCNYTPKELEKLPPEEWQQEQFDEVMKSMKYHASQKAEDETRTAERNEILQIFKAELASLSEASS